MRKTTEVKHKQKETGRKACLSDANVWGNGQSDNQTISIFNLEFDGDGVGIQGLVDFGVCILQSDLLLLLVEGIVLFQSSGDLIDDLLVRFVPIELLQSVDDKLFTGNSDLFAILPRLAPIPSFGGLSEKFCAFRSCYFQKLLLPDR